jgi:hypothetical protein
MRKLIFPRRSWPNHSPKYMSAFAIVVEGNSIYNFGIHMFPCSVQKFGANHGQSRVDLSTQALWHAEASPCAPTYPAPRAPWPPQDRKLRCRMATRGPRPLLDPLAAPGLPRARRSAPTPAPAARSAGQAHTSQRWSDPPSSPPYASW